MVAWAQTLTFAYLGVVFGFIIGGIFNSIFFVLVGAIFAAALGNYFYTKMKNKVESRKEDCVSELPEVVSTIAMLMNSGMTLKEVWELVANSKEGTVYSLMKQSCIDMKNGMTEKEAAIRLQDFSNVCASEGYTKLSENQLCTIVVQYLLKSKDGNKRDKWLKDKVSEYLKEHLGWRGIGVVESFAIDNGKLNIYCIVVEEERAVSAIKSCLKTYRLDLTHAIIAARNWDDEGFRVKYSYKPINDFSVI